MIEIIEIQNPIAKDVWKTKSKDGRVVSHQIIVGHSLLEDSDNLDSDWYYPVMIEGFLPRITPAMGVGPVDSLLNRLPVP